MKPYIIDAFTTVPFGGNAAGVVLISGEYPKDEEMLALAKELNLSETAFVRPMSGQAVELRYFTPADEVDLCGHATVASFRGLLEWGLVEAGRAYTAKTQAGPLNVDVGEDGSVWLDMAPPMEAGVLSGVDTAALYAMFGLSASDAGGLAPAIVNTGLPDIMMPLGSRAELKDLRPDFPAVEELSKRLGVTGVHAFTLGEEGVTAHARNFAPLFGINEESATGTSNGALTFYLYNRGIVKPNALNLFIQGEAMGRPSQILSRLYDSGKGVVVRVGGHAAIRP